MHKILQLIEQWLRRIGSHPWFLRGVFCVAVTTVAGLYIWPQPPGIAVAVLGVGAIIMTFRVMTATHKLLWCSFAVSLLLLEYRAIYRDHAEQQASQQASLKIILKDNRNATEKILKKNQAQFTVTEQRFSNVDELATKGLMASNSALSAINGENSYAYVLPIVSEKTIGLTVRGQGPNPLIGVGVTVTREKPSFGQVFPNLGTVRRGTLGTIFFNITPIQYQIGWDQYRIYVTSQNGEGEINELLDIKGKPGEWLVKYTIWRMRPPRTDVEGVKNTLLLHTDWWDGSDKTELSTLHFAHRPKR